MAKIHGNYTLDTMGEIGIVKFHDAWNEECSKEFFESYTKFVQGKKFDQFGVLADLRCLSGATPEAAKYMIKVSLWGTENGQIARGQIIDSEFKLFTVKELQKLDLKFPIKSFNDTDTAIHWLREQGLKEEQNP